VKGGSGWMQVDEKASTSVGQVYVKLPYEKGFYANLPHEKAFYANLL